MKNILFICTGNTCRSTIAEALFKHLLELNNAKASDFKVVSAGTCAWEGDKASTLASQVLKERGIDVKYHRSTPVSLELIDEADLILAMTFNHKMAILQMRPSAKEKVFTLKEYVAVHHGNLKELGLSQRDFDYDVKDPYGQSIDVYRNSAKEIEEALQKIINTL